MAAVSSNQGNVIVTFTDISIVYSFDGDNYVERLLEHVNASTKEDSDNNEESVPIICTSFSPNSEYFTCCIHKDLNLWNTREWNLLSKREVNRSSSAILITPKNDNIAIADKSGDVYLFSIEDPEKVGELILGHVSMLLDILITPNSKYIVTCDRDEKIRLSCYPNAYNIKSYCLGHEEFVTCLSMLPHTDDILVSGSGDGTLRFWDYEMGKQLLSYGCNEVGSEFQECNKIVISKIVSFKISDKVSVLCVQVLLFKGILIYVVSSESNTDLTCTFKELLTVESEPWSFSFSDNRLWVFKENVDDALSAYNFCTDKNKFAADCSRCSIKNELKKHSILLENIFKKNRHLNMFYKRRFDNTQEYLKRKMLRIETDAKKSKNTSISEIT